MAEGVVWDRQKSLAASVKPKCDCKHHVPCPCSGATCKLCFFDPRHGTTNAYTNCRCRCEPCRTANASLMENYRNRLSRLREDGQMPEDRHGTEDGYHNWKCRCVPCTGAWNEESADRYWRQKQGLTDCGQGLVPKPKPRRKPLMGKEDDDARTT